MDNFSPEFITSYILLGSNQGDRALNMEKAIDLLQTLGHPGRRSAIYETEAWGKTDQPSFYNQVIELKISLPPAELLHALLGFEKSMGRVRREKWGDRIIDLDILLYGDLIISEPDLQIPHPGIPARRFTLVPLCEIAPNLIHPKLKVTTRELLETCPDKLTVKRI